MPCSASCLSLEQSVGSEAWRRSGGPGVSSPDLYQSRKLLTSGTSGAARCPPAPSSGAAAGGRRRGPSVSSQPLLCRMMGKELQFLPSLQLCFSSSVPFGRICLRLLKQRVSQGNSSWGGAKVPASPVSRLLAWM